MCKEQGVDIKQDATDRQLKEAVTLKLIPGMKFDGQDDAYVNASYDIAMKSAGQAPRRRRQSAQKSDAHPPRWRGKTNSQCRISAPENGRPSAAARKWRVTNDLRNG
ncbi:hypothetical protein [Vreelandella aquamarina]|uniref:hypothetical protein n=1 Tax=Vreelandella aquamarina TaxID=77097 RepID=UPI001C2C7FF9|nr:hypothetical protein [Halomonas meridiana]